MTSEQFRYRAFLGTLGALVVMFIGGCLLALAGKSVEAIGVGGAITGLIGLAGVLAGGKQQGDEFQELMRTAMERLADSTPPTREPSPGRVEKAAGEGARAGAAEGVDEALGDGTIKGVSIGARTRAPVVDLSGQE